jgi:hypothetical protein
LNPRICSKISKWSSSSRENSQNSISMKNYRIQSGRGMDRPERPGRCLGPTASRTSKGAWGVPDTKAQERSRRHADAAAPLLGDGGRGGNARGGWAARGLWASVGGLIFFVSFFLLIAYFLFHLYSERKRLLFLYID